MPEYKYIPIEQLIEPPNPVRFSMDEAALMSLAESIKKVGVLQPPLVVPVPRFEDVECDNPEGTHIEQRPVPPNRFEIVVGHRRYKACIMANQNAVPCLVFADKELAKHAAMIIENAERQDVSPAEEAAYFHDLIEKYDFTEEELLNTVHRSATYVYARLDLFNGNQEVFQALADRKINMAVATQLNRCKDAGHTSYLLTLAINGGATAATVAKWVSDYRVSPGGETVTAAATDSPEREAAAAVTDERVCILCRRSHQPLNLVPCWVHDWELRDLNERMDNAAAVDIVPNKSAQGA